MKTTQIFTHKGWFGFAPVYLGNLGEDDALQVVARLNCLEWLITLNGFIFNLLGAETFPFKITGELKEPFELTRID